MRAGIHCGPLAGIIHTYADVCKRMLVGIYCGLGYVQVKQAPTVFPGAGIVLGNCMRFYCLYGNTMNVASRMCSNAKEGGICASRDLVRRLEGPSDRADSASEPQSSVSSVCASREVVRRLEGITDSGSEAPSSVTEPQSSVNANERSTCASRDLCYLNGIMQTYADVC